MTQKQENIENLVSINLELVIGKHVQYILNIDNCGTVILSAWVDSISWNHVIPSFEDKISIQNCINNGEKIFSSIGRRCCFYILDSPQHSIMEPQLKSCGYVVTDREYWLSKSNWTILKKSSPNKISFLPIDMTNINQIGEFVSSFSKGFEFLPISYSHQIFLSLICNNTNLIHIGAYLGKTIVGIGSCYYQGQYAGIFNVTVESPFRKMGIGRELVNTLSSFAANKGCKTIFLQCDGATKDFYLKQGFFQISEARLYIKQ